MTEDSKSDIEKIIEGYHGFLAKNALETELTDVVKYLEELSSETTIMDELAERPFDSIIDYCDGENFDDAYSSGVEDGKTVLARQILKMLTD